VSSEITLEVSLAESDAKEGELCLFRQKNKLTVGEAAEIITPRRKTNTADEPHPPL
jgi:hypothetical protein